MYSQQNRCKHCDDRRVSYSATEILELKALDENASVQSTLNSRFNDEFDHKQITDGRSFKCSNCRNKVTLSYSEDLFVAPTIAVFSIDRSVQKEIEISSFLRLTNLR